MHSEGIVELEACHVQQDLLVPLQIVVVHLPRPPLLHDTEEFDFVVGSKDELFHQSHRNSLLNGAHAHVLIDNLHAEAGHLATVILVAINVGQLFDLLEDQVVQLHKLHARERFDVQESHASGELEWALVLHVLFVVEDAVPDRLGCLFIPLLLAHWRRVVQVWILEVSAETTNSGSGKH